MDTLVNTDPSASAWLIKHSKPNYRYVILRSDSKVSNYMSHTEEANPTGNSCSQAILLWGEVHNESSEGGNGEVWSHHIHTKKWKCCNGLKSERISGNTFGNVSHARNTSPCWPNGPDICGTLFTRSKTSCLGWTFWVLFPEVGSIINIFWLLWTTFAKVISNMRGKGSQDC